MRPADWFLVELDDDPTPGEAFGIRGLSARYAAIAEIADDAARGVHAARTSGTASTWIGEAGDVFRDRSHRMPGELSKAGDSYARTAEALARWADAVDDTQAQADRGLQQAREASADRVSAVAALDQAHAAWTTAHAQQLTYQRLQKNAESVPPPRGAATPTPELRSVARAVSQSQADAATASRRIADADARLAAARALVLDAKSRRDDAERRTVTQIAEAADHAVQPSSVWEAIQSSAAWQVIVQVATVVLTILSIVAIFVGGPLVWALILAATILLVANALLSLAQGKDAWGELALLAIGLIPGGRLLGLAAKGVAAVGRMGVAGERVASSVGAVAGAVRSGSAVVTHTVDLAGARIADLATTVPRGSLRAIHSGSADTGTLRSIFNRDYKDVFEVNATNLRTKVGYTTNCTRCVIATDHTLDGAVSAAMPVFDKSASISVIADHFGQSVQDFKPMSGYDSVVQTMEGLGEGSRAIVAGGRGPGRVGHVFNVVHDANGVVFLDGQSGWFARLEDFRSLSILITKVGPS